jgi:CrcB protein
VGVLGGYTTFSAFGRETFVLMSDGQWGRAAANIVLSVVVGLAAVWAGTMVAGRLIARAP